MPLMNSTPVLPCVADQTRARAFHRTVLAATRSLDVPGMTESDLVDGARVSRPLDYMAAKVSDLTNTGGDSASCTCAAPMPSRGRNASHELAGAPSPRWHGARGVNRWPAGWTPLATSSPSPRTEHS